MKKMPKSVRDWDIKEKVRLIVSNIDKNDDEVTYGYPTDLIPYFFEDDPDIPIIQQKMDNLMKILNTEGGFDRIKNMDFEDEIWYML